VVRKPARRVVRKSKAKKKIHTRKPRRAVKRRVRRHKRIKRRRHYKKSKRLYCTVKCNRRRLWPGYPQNKFFPESDKVYEY
jgi:hypothetical protein